MVDSIIASSSQQGVAAPSAAAGPRAMSRVLRLLDLLARRPEGMSLTELGLALEVPKSTFVSSLKALVSDGMLLCENNRYRLGPGAYRLASTILTSLSMPHMIRHYLLELAKTTRESVGFAIADWEIGQVIYVDAINSRQPVHYSMRAGLRAPLYASAAGRTLLAFAGADRRNHYLAKAHLKPLTDATCTTTEGIEAGLKRIAQTGYCASFGEMLKDTAAIAVPVFDSANTVIGALMVAAPIDRMRSNFEYLRQQTISLGREASGLAPEYVAQSPL